MRNRTAQFLVDAAIGTGLGHLRRSEVLLREMAKEGFDCTLFCQDPAVALSIGLPARKLPTTPQQIPKCDVIVCDSYLIDARQLARFREQSKILVAFDDLGTKQLSADVILNHNLYGDVVDYSHARSSIVLAGSEYTLVRPEIIEAARRFAASRPSNNVVVSFGGTDNGNLASPIVEALLTTPVDQIYVVIAPGNIPSGEIEAIEAYNEDRVHIHLNPNVPELLTKARLYVGAGGMTATEAHIIGLEMIVCVIAENQRLNANAFAKFGHKVIQGVDPRLVAQSAGRILNSSFNRRHLLVDGRGASRIVQVVSRLLDGS